jgi:hypothetical protein
MLLKTNDKVLMDKILTYSFFNVPIMSSESIIICT